MNAMSNERSTSRERGCRPSSDGDWRMDALVDRLPPRLAGTVSYLRQPTSRWIRIPAGVALIGGGVLSFLPVLGVWMLPLGLVLLAEDVPVLKSSRSRILDWIEHRRPNWLKTTSRANDPP